MRESAVEKLATIYAHFREVHAKHDKTLKDLCTARGIPISVVDNIPTHRILEKLCKEESDDFRLMIALHKLEGQVNYIKFNDKSYDDIIKMYKDIHSGQLSDKEAIKAPLSWHNLIYLVLHSPYQYFYELVEAGEIDYTTYPMEFLRRTISYRSPDVIQSDYLLDAYLSRASEQEVKDLVAEAFSPKTCFPVGCIMIIMKIDGELARSILEEYKAEHHGIAKGPYQTLESHIKANEIARTL